MMTDRTDNTDNYNPVASQSNKFIELADRLGSVTTLGDKVSNSPSNLPDSQDYLSFKCE